MSSGSGRPERRSRGRRRAEPATRVFDGREHRLYSVACTGEGTAAAVRADRRRRRRPDPPASSTRSKRATPTARPVDQSDAGSERDRQPRPLARRANRRRSMPITAQAGPAVWITVTPTLSPPRSTSATATRSRATGTGVPIESVHPDLDVVEQSPTCGYTYRHSSPDDQPFQLSITTTWTLPYESSGGSRRDPAARTHDHPRLRRRRDPDHRRPRLTPATDSRLGANRSGLDRDRAQTSRTSPRQVFLHGEV